MLAIAFVVVPITLTGLIGNLLVLIVIALNTQMHDSTSLFICNLALADLLFLAFCVPLTGIAYFFKYWPFSDFLCYITVSLQYITCYVSVWTLVLLAHDRYISISSSVTGRSIRRCRIVFYICTSVWLIVLILNSVQMRNVGVLRFEYNGIKGSVCVDSLAIALTTATPIEARLFYWGFNIGAYLLPLTLSCVFYFLLVKKIWRQKVVHSRSTQNLLLVQSVIQALAYVNSCVNPILYGLFSERFRFAFRQTISRLLCLFKLNNSIINFPASFANFSIQNKNNSIVPPSIYSNNSKRPSSTLTIGGGINNKLININNGLINNNNNSPNSPSLTSQNSVEDRRKSLLSQQSMQLLTTLTGNRLTTLGEEIILNENNEEEKDDFSEDDVVLL
ncbi:G_PROTEIN_RECEP_F1_2 domain-containing protein [Meloidogyne graminicola]|uniref:G_PROTEIN_RECEP_F1_2 domain-containing protein n=1 Tax=Meloidogyne graminicola TaxID=189291 RepID=A0A8T0A0K4_9BILA|nr:G_PROTEIN_RECEP_F1_2 domain-containing protein [Meloidogyne graminicola]